MKMQAMTPISLSILTPKFDEMSKEQIEKHQKWLEVRYSLAKYTRTLVF